MNFLKSSSFLMAGSKLLFIVVLLGFTSQTSAMYKRRFVDFCHGTIKVFEVIEGSTCGLGGLGSMVGCINKIVQNKKTNKNMPLNALVAKIKLDSEISEVSEFNEVSGSAAFSPFNADIVAYSNGNNDIVVYDISKRKEVALLKGHTKMVASIAFSYFNDNELVSCSCDKTVRVWNFATSDQSKFCLDYSDYPSYYYYPGRVILSPKNPNLMVVIFLELSVEIYTISGEKGLTLLKDFRINHEIDHAFSLGSVFDYYSSYVRFSIFYPNILFYKEGKNCEKARVLYLDEEKECRVVKQEAKFFLDEVDEKVFSVEIDEDFEKKFGKCSFLRSETFVQWREGDNKFKKKLLGSTHKTTKNKKFCDLLVECE